jgi:hypothetical protein
MGSLYVGQMKLRFVQETCDTPEKWLFENLPPHFYSDDANHSGTEQKEVVEAAASTCEDWPFANLSPDLFSDIDNCPPASRPKKTKFKVDPKLQELIDAWLTPFDPAIGHIIWAHSVIAGVPSPWSLFDKNFY